MNGYIKDIDWINLDAMKYWSFGASYKGDKKVEAKNLVMSGNYLGALKVDGYYQRLVIDEDGNISMIARSKSVTGEAVNKIDWVPHLKEFASNLPKGTVLLCECYLPGHEGSQNITKLLGCLADKCIARQEKEGKLHLYVFDVMAYNGENYYTTAAEKRFAKLEEIKHIYRSEFVEWATYYEGPQLWDMLQAYLASDREGIVITRKDCPVYNKRTPARMTLKIKKELKETIDCFFTGRVSAPTKEYTGKELETWEYWIRQDTEERLEGNHYKEYFRNDPVIPVTKPYYYKWAGSLEIGVLDKNNQVVPIGWLSGVSDEIKAHPEDYKHKCIEVGAMMRTNDGNLRHAKMIGFRDDLTINDCTIEKIEH